MGNPVSPLEAHYGALSGHPMPGYKYIDENGEEQEAFTFPTQEEINKQDTPFLRACLDLNYKIHLFGLPHNQGWINERRTVLRIREICESVRNKYESWHMDHAKELEDRE